MNYRDPEQLNSALSPTTHFAKRSDRTLIRQTSALRNSEWKAATVLAGSVIEALLLWALRLRTPTEIETARTLVKEKRGVDVSKREVERLAPA
jgi:hypothetical protein